MQAAEASSLPPGVDVDYYPNAEDQKKLTVQACEEFQGLTSGDVVERLAREQSDATVATTVRRELPTILNCVVDSTRAQQPVAIVNASNFKVHQQHLSNRLHPQMQKHGGDLSSRLHVSGSFPVTTVLEEGEERDRKSVV